MAYVYRHIRTDKNQPFYIGIGSDSEYKRANERTRRSELWKKIAKKSDYIVEIIADDVSVEFAKEKEIEFISLYGRIDKGTGTLCNLTDGGDGINGYIFTASHREKLSEKAKVKILSEEQKEKLRKARLGIKNSEEARRKISLANKNRKNSPEQNIASSIRMKNNNPSKGKTGKNSITFKGFIEAYKDGLLIGKYDGVYDVANKLNVAATKVSAVLRGRRNHTGGYTFIRIDKNQTI
jgi:hypothetical protein